MPTLAPAPLEAYAAAIWRGLGAPAADAATVAAALVDANLCGHDSHGIIRIPQWARHLGEGKLRPGAALTTVRETPAVAVVDGGWNFGAVVATTAAELAIEKARTAGAASVSIRRSHHIGRLADYCLQAAEQGLVMQVLANNHRQAAAVAPWGGREKRLATNPVAFGFPRPGHSPIVVDVTTAVAPEGKVRVLVNRGEQAPPGWLLDAAGRPTTDPNAFYADPPGCLLPLGGDVGHKGYGLSVAVELLAGALGGGGCTTPRPLDMYGNAALFSVWDPAAFDEPAAYAERVEALVADLKNCARQPGVDEILLPGEPEQRTRERRRREGIPIDETTWAQVAEVARGAGVSPPEAATD